MTFTHLRLHSYFSLQEALSSPAELVQAAQASGMNALALTDHLYLTGAVEFYLACRQAGIQPVLGLELDLLPPADLGALIEQGGPHLLALLATNLAGWGNLCWLSSALFTLPEGGGQAGKAIPCPFDWLVGHSDGLIALTGGQASLLNALVGADALTPAAAWLERLQTVFPGRLYVELQANNPHNCLSLPVLAGLAGGLALPTVATQPVYTLSDDQAALQRLLTAIRLNQPLSHLPSSAFLPGGSTWTSPAVIAAWFKAYPAALKSTQEIAERCAFDLSLGTVHFPVVPVPDGITPLQFLRQKAEAGARRLYGVLTDEIKQRLDHELAVIGERGFEPIFLIVEELLAFARHSDVPFSSRGSAASSLVAHCLGITSPDPLRLDLYFERFLNPARSTPPDIDTDLCSRRRDLVIQHVFDTYGAERVSMVGTINRYRPRSALGDVAKANGLTPFQVRALMSGLPYRFWGPGRDNEGAQEDPYAELAMRYPNGPYQAMLRDARAILGLPRHLSMHAGGIVISPGPMTERLPVMRSGGKGVTITQVDLESVEQLGLVKIDLLGIRGLTVLGDVAGAIRSWRSSEVHSSLDVLDEIPFDDAPTSASIENGRTIGCFQIESPGMRSTLKEIRARNLDDLMVALALYRPGPLNGGLKDAFVRRFKGEETTTHLHPALAPLLDETFGVIVYQEQVLRIANRLAGFSLAEADLLRRGMSQGGAHAHGNHPGDRMALLRDKFIAGAGITSLVDPETAARIWDLMAAFAGYGFPKAHAASYAQIAWRSAWCKTHHPAEFMAAVLANWGGYYSQRVYLMEARRMGLAVRPPHVNTSQRDFCVSYRSQDPALFMGLDQVKGLTRHTQEQIIRSRPFTSLEDFLVRGDPRQTEAIALARIGAFEGLGSIPAILRRLERGGWRAGQLSLFEENSPDEEEWSLNERVAAQEEILGLGIDAHPLELVAAQMVASGAITTVDAVTHLGQKVRVAGVRQTIHRSRTARGETMAHLTFEDLEGMLDVVFFPDAYKRCRHVLEGSDPILVEGTIDYESDSAEPVLKADRAWKFGD